MLGCHSLDPQLWIDAARYEMTEMKAVESARKLIFRGLKFHPKNKDLHEEVRLDQQLTDSYFLYKFYTAALKEWILGNVEFCVCASRLVITDFEFNFASTSPWNSPT